ncbi:hypothetical protein AAID96_03390 [Campylobacter coli]
MILIKNGLLNIFFRQLNFLYECDILMTLEKLDFCFSYISQNIIRKFWLKNVHHTPEYAMFLYYLSKK